MDLSMSSGKKFMALFIYMNKHHKTTKLLVNDAAKCKTLTVSYAKKN